MPRGPIPHSRCARSNGRNFVERPQADAEESQLAWYHEVVKEEWETPIHVKAKLPNAGVIGDDRVVFNIRGNAYRLVVKIHHPTRIDYVRFVGTHAEYDLVDAREV